LRSSLRRCMYYGGWGHPVGYYILKPPWVWIRVSGCKRDRGQDSGCSKSEYKPPGCSGGWWKASGGCSRGLRTRKMALSRYTRLVTKSIIEVVPAMVTSVIYLITYCLRFGVFTKKIIIQFYILTWIICISIIYRWYFMGYNATYVRVKNCKSKHEGNFNNFCTHFHIESFEEWQLQYGIRQSLRSSSIESVDSMYCTQ
jgi:hypothetical protein